jgi:hypothetical protein
VQQAEAGLYALYAIRNCDRTCGHEAREDGMSARVWHQDGKYEVIAGFANCTANIVKYRPEDYGQGVFDGMWGVNGRCRCWVYDTGEFQCPNPRRRLNALV